MKAKYFIYSSLLIDWHAKDGFCNAVRVADINGKVVKGVFKSENFALTKN
jgi:hypothetical protein